MNREELIQKAIALGRTPEDAAKIADAWIAKQDESKGEKKAAPKATPPAKAPPKPPAAKTPEPPKPSPAVAAQVPRVVEKETVKVTTAPIGPARPDMSRDYSDTMPPMTRSRAAEVMPKPEMDLIGIKQGGEGVYAPRAAAMPSVMKYAEADLVGDETRNMRGTLKAVRPELAAAVDEAPDEEVRSLYYRMVK